MLKFTKPILLMLGLSSTLYAEVQPLFYETYNFEEDDVLNIREQPNYQARKIGELSLQHGVEVLSCRSMKSSNIKSSKWCKIKPLYYTESIGWVNANYLRPKPYQQGYVTVKNKKSTCDYVMKCKEEKQNTLCLVVTELVFGKEMKDLSLKSKWFNIEDLKPATAFSAMYSDDPDAEGHCTAAKYIHEHQNNQKLKVLSKQFPSPAFSTVTKLLTALNQRDSKSMQKLIHPSSGLTLSALSYFDEKRNQHFTAKTFLTNYHSRNKLFWGRTEARGNVIQKDLYAYLEALPSDIAHISKVVTLKDFKEYPKKHKQQLKAYEIYWDMDKKNKEYAYQGLVVVLEYHKGQWYVVGITRDYWTP